MNWIDIVVLAVVAFFVLLCWKRGFLLSLISFASIFISFIVTLKFYPPLAAFLMKTQINTNLVNSISANLSSNPAVSNAINSQVQSTVGNVLDSVVFLPDFVKRSIINSLGNASDLLPMRQIIDYISVNIAKLVITGLSILLLFVACRLALFIVKLLIKSINKLPVLKQADKLLGITIGLLEGLLVVYTGMAVIVLLGSMPQFKSVVDAVDKSLLAVWFYKNNLLLGLFG